MTIIKSVLENLEWGRNFLRNSQLRSLRNLSWMPHKARDTVVASMDLSSIDKSFIYCWLYDYKSLRNYWGWFSEIVKSEKDDYLYCYTPQLELTQLGQRMKDETYRAQARA